MKDKRIVIVGAGPAGISAATKFVNHGVRPIIIDEDKQSGGQVFRRQPKEFKRTPQNIYGFEAKSAIQEHLNYEKIADKIETRFNTIVCGIENQSLYLFNGVNDN